MTREEWLNTAKGILIPYVQRYTTNAIPSFYLSIGLPKGAYTGQCWSGELSDDGIPHIFISPTIDNPIDVLTILIHEIIHTAYPLAGHRVQFSQVASNCGLVKPWVQSNASA